MSMDDRDRPLNDRGKRDAPVMAERLLERKLEIDAFISSPAKRARKTAEIFAKTFDQGKKDVEIMEELYEAGQNDFDSVIANLPNKYTTVAIFSHNPGITEFANGLTPTKIDNIPTSGVFAVKAETNDWKSFASASKHLLFFDYPKSLLD
jgi:phosphohistidine phosphatase